MQANETQASLDLVRSARLAVRKAGQKIAYTVHLDGVQIGVRKGTVAYRAVRVFLGEGGAEVAGYHKKVQTAVDQARRDNEWRRDQGYGGTTFVVEVDQDGSVVLQGIEAGWRADQARSRRAAERDQTRADREEQIEAEADEAELAEDRADRAAEKKAALGEKARAGRARIAEIDARIEQIDGDLQGIEDRQEARAASNTPHVDDDVSGNIDDSMLSGNARDEAKAKADGARSPRLSQEEAAEALFRLAAYADDGGYKLFEVVLDIREIAGRLRS